MKNHIIKAVGAVKKEKCTQSPWKGFRKVFQLNGISSIVVGVKNSVIFWINKAHTKIHGQYGPLHFKMGLNQEDTWQAQWYLEISPLKKSKNNWYYLVTNLWHPVNGKLLFLQILVEKATTGLPKIHYICDFAFAYDGLVCFRPTLLTGTTGKAE